MSSASDVLSDVPAVLPSEFPASWASDWGEDIQHGLWMSFQYRGVRQQLRWIPPGTFLMGSPESAAERSDNETLHRVTLSQGFWLADTTCTQALWQVVMGANPRHFQGAERPVEQVSWEAVQRFLWRYAQRYWAAAAILSLTTLVRCGLTACLPVPSPLLCCTQERDSVF